MWTVIEDYVPLWPANSGHYRKVTFKMLPTNYYVYQLLILQSCGYVFCESKCTNSDVYLTVSNALTDLVHDEFHFVTHVYIIYNNNNFDWEDTLDSVNFTFETYDSSYLNVLLLKAQCDRTALLVVSESLNMTNIGNITDLKLEQFQNILFISLKKNFSADASYQSLNYKVLVPHSLTSKQAELWQYTHGLDRRLIGIWEMETGWNITDRKKVKRSTLEGRKLKTALLPAFKVSTRSEINGSIVYSGLYVDYIDLLAADLDFTCTFVEPEDTVYGSDFDGDGQWNGIIGMAQRGEIDIGLAPFTQTVERRKVVDYLEYVTYSGLAMMMKKPESSIESDYLAAFKPFKPELWIVFVSSILFSSFVLWFYLRLVYYITNANVSCSSLTLFRNCLRYVTGAACCQGGQIPDNSSSLCRILVGSVWITFIILSFSYVANLISYIAVPMAPLPANSLQELAEQKTHQVGLTESSSHEILFRNATSGYFKQIWDKIQSDPDNLVSVNQALVKVRNEKFIFITEHSYLLLLLSGDCNFVLGEEIFLTRYLGWITPKNWPHAKLFNEKLTILRESGILNSIFNKYTLSHLACGKKPGAIQLGLQSLRGVFTLLLVGCLTGLIVLSLENIHSYRMKRKQNNQLRTSNDHDASLKEWCIVTNDMLQPVSFAMIAGDAREILVNHFT